MRRAILFVTPLILSMVANPAGALPVANEILAKMERAMDPGTDVRADIELTITNARGERVHWLGEYFRSRDGKLRKRFVFSNPLDIRGLELSVERGHSGDVIQVYLPSLRRVRTIRTDLAVEAFAGTDFNYSHLGFEQLEFYDHEILAEEKEPESGRKCYKIKSNPQPDSGIWYGKVVRWIDKKTYLPLRTEYFDPRGDLYKIRTLSAVEKIDGYWTATLMTMKTVQNETWSRMRFDDVEYDTGLAEPLVTGPMR